MTLVYIIMGSIIVISFITGVVLTKKENKLNKELKLGDDPTTLFTNQNSVPLQQENPVQSNVPLQQVAVNQNAPVSVVNSIPTQPVVQNFEQKNVSAINTQQVVNPNLQMPSSVVSNVPASAVTPQTNVISNPITLPNEQPTIINSVVQNPTGIATQNNIATPVTSGSVSQDSEVI